MFENLKGQASAWLRERQGRIAAKKAAQRREGHDSRFWLLSIPATATLCAAFVEVYWAVLFCIQATGRLDNDWAVAFGTGQASTGAWHFAFDIRSVPVLIGLVAATVPIVMWSMVWLPVQMKARGTGRWRRTTMIGAGLLANALVIVSGTVVMNSNRQEQVRAGQVVEQQAGQGRAQLQSQIDGITGDLNTMFNNRNAYMAQAASVGAARWQSTYVTQARATNDPRLPMIERALGAAQSADDARARRDALRAQLAAAPTQAAVAAHVEDHAGVGLDTFATYANVYRPPFVALICTIIGIFGTWWWVGLAEAMSHHNVSLSGWAPEDHRIEDLRDEAEVIAQPMRPAREELRDADTKELIIDKDGDLASQVKAHTRKKKDKDGKPIKMMIQPDIPPNEKGAPAGLDHGDDGLRSAALHGEHEPLVAQGVVQDLVESLPTHADAKPNAEQHDGEVHQADERQNDVLLGVGEAVHDSISEEEALAAQETLMAADFQPAVDDAVEPLEETVHDATEPEAEQVEMTEPLQHDSLLQTPPQQVADFGHDVGEIQDGEEDQPAHEEQSEGHDDGLTEAFARANERTPETDPRRLITADAE